MMRYRCMNIWCLDEWHSTMVCPRAEVRPSRPHPNVELTVADWVWKALLALVVFVVLVIVI